MFSKLSTISWFTTVMVAIAALAGCGRTGSSAPSSELDEILAAGNRSLEEMKVSGPKQEYAKYFHSYEALRLFYLEASQALEQDAANADHTQALDVLAQWESMILAARNVWHGPVLEPPELPFGELSPDNKKSPEEPPSVFERLIEEGKENQKQIEDKWAPIDAQVDEAMRKMQERRAGNR